MKQEFKDRNGFIIVPFDLEDRVYFMYDNKLNCGTIHEINIISAGDEHYAEIRYKVKIIGTNVLILNHNQCYKHPYEVLASLLYEYNNYTYRSMIETLQSEANADLEAINKLNSLKHEVQEATVD